MRVSPLLLILALATAVSALHLQALPPNPNTNPRPAPTPTPTPNYPTPTPTPTPNYPNPNPNNYPRPNPSPSPAPSGQVTANGVTFTFNGPFKYTCYYKDRPNEVYRWDSCYDINGCSLMIKDYMNCKGRIVKEQLPRWSYKLKSVIQIFIYPFMNNNYDKNIAWTNSDAK